MERLLETAILEAKNEKDIGKMGKGKHKQRE